MTFYLSFPCSFCFVVIVAVFFRFLWMILVSQCVCFFLLAFNFNATFGMPLTYGLDCAARVSAYTLIIIIVVVVVWQVNTVCIWMTISLNEQYSFAILSIRHSHWKCFNRHIELHSIAVNIKNVASFVTVVDSCTHNHDDDDDGGGDITASMKGSAHEVREMWLTKLIWADLGGDSICRLKLV